VVCTPSSYTKDSSSSLVVAFEDSDGSRVKELAAKYLYAFGTRTSVKKGKRKQRINKSHSSNSPNADDEDVDTILDHNTAKTTKFQTSNARPKRLPASSRA
jgi:hypothetical protein